MSKEIEFQTLEIELCNKKIKEALVRISEKENELQMSHEAIEDRNNDLDMKRNELDEIMEETRSEEERLKIKVKEYEAKIERVCSLRSSVYVRAHATVSESFMCSVMLAEVASIRFRHSVSLI